jgi:hypothetical protein
MAGFKPRRAAVRRESPLQKAIVEFHALVVVEPDLAILFHVPNGEKRDKATAGQLVGRRPVAIHPGQEIPEAELLRPAGLGVLPGVHDLILLTPGPRTDFIEVKTAADELRGLKAGRVSPEQRRFSRAIERMGFHQRLVRSVDEYWDLLTELGVKMRAAQRLASGALWVPP